MQLIHRNRIKKLPCVACSPNLPFGNGWGTLEIPSSPSHIQNFTRNLTSFTLIFHVFIWISTGKAQYVVVLMIIAHSRSCQGRLHKVRLTMQNGLFKFLSVISRSRRSLLTP